MTDLQRIMLQRIELQKRINSMTEVRSDEPDKLADRQKLITDLDALDDRYKLAITDDGAPGTPEAREWADLNDRFDLGEMFGNVMEHRSSSGVIAEVQTERGLGGNDMPVEMLMEHRAVTPAPSETGQFQAPIEPFVFPQSAAAFLGIPSPIVPVGSATFPVLTSDPLASLPGENTAVGSTTGAFSADALEPKRITAQFFWSREVQARFMGMSDALMEALQGGPADKLDEEVLAGTEGLFTGTKLQNHARNSASDYAHYVANLLYARVDGTYAGDLSDIRVLMGSDTFGNAATKLPTNGEVNALARIRNDSAGVRVSAHVPDAANNKQEAVVRLGTRRDMVAPVWGAVTLIPDEVTKAAEGQVVLTAVLLHAVKILRTGGFYKQETNHS